MRGIPLKDVSKLSFQVLEISLCRIFKKEEENIPLSSF